MTLDRKQFNSNYKMKKFFLIAAAAALVLSSCSKNTVSEDTSEANAIGFGTYTGRSITKADGSFVNNDDKTNLPNGSVFHVLGYAATTNLTATNFKDNFQFGDVTFSGTAYTYATKYWPKAAGIQISCYAYYPVSSNVTAAAPSSNLGSYTVTAPADPTKQSDFMISDVEPDMTYSTSKTISGSTKDGEVAILFHHMLSQVGVKVKLDQVVDGIHVTVKSIDFMNLYSKGVCTPSYDPATKKTSFGWTGQNTKYTGNISLPMPATSVVLNATDFKTVADGNSAALLLIPQTIPSGTTIAHIVFTVSDGTTEKDVPADITTTSDSELVLGTRLTYNVTFKLFYDSSDEGGKYAITFTAQVAPWTDASQSVTL
jgi:hypothetical protein